MKKLLVFLILGLCINLNTNSTYHSETGSDILIDDGPYIFNVNNELLVKWVENNSVREEFVTADNFAGIKRKFKLLFNYDDLNQNYHSKPDFKQCYTGVDSMGIITDIHGEYKTYLNLLKAMGIIDRSLNWKFGRGHLVVIGDTFDRGDMVTEVFWHLFGLEKQAANAGGQVHMLLGNHEFLVLNKNLNYISDKYKSVEIITKMHYYDLYSTSSVLGKWLRSKPVIITINNILFVHAGISMEMVQRHLTIDQINRKFAGSIARDDPGLIFSDEEVDFLYKNKGPIWYRGYFNDSHFYETRLDSILDFYQKEHIVIGHTPNEGIISLFNTKILGTDTGIMYKQPDEMLMYKNGYFYKVSLKGTRIKLQ
jgi:hypothetical protein